jgi:hypothetical protein
LGAQPSDRVARFLDAAGIRERAARNNPKKAEPGEKAKERIEERAAKLAEAEEAKAAAPQLRRSRKLLRRLRPRLPPRNRRLRLLLRKHPLKPLQRRLR